MSKQAFTLKLKNDRKSGEQELLIEGDLGTGSAEALKNKLQSAEYGSSVVIRLRKIESFDLSTVQILYSVLKTLSLKGINARIDADLSERHEKLISANGFNEIIRKQ
ncbi:MAG: STAS domain-containing protein [Bacteroidota bacterium]